MSQPNQVCIQDTLNYMSIYIKLYIQQLVEDKQHEEEDKKQQIEQCDVQQMCLLVNYLIINLNLPKLNEHKIKIIEYYEKNNVDGIKFKNTKKKELNKAICNYLNNDKKANGPLNKLHAKIKNYDFNDWDKILSFNDDDIKDQEIGTQKDKNVELSQ